MNKIEKNGWVWFSMEVESPYNLEGVILPGYDTALEYGEIGYDDDLGTLYWGYPLEVEVSINPLD